ncbi:MAG: right-handed parallel beta-helix repeat-containing protein [Chitinispirillaceae bacterium]
MTTADISRRIKPGVVFWLLMILLTPFSTSARSFTVPSKDAENISEIMVKVKRGDTVFVEEGVYRERIFITPGVSLISKSMLKAVIDGRGRDKVVTMGNHGLIQGFEITGGTIGVYSDAQGNQIKKCLIHGNKQTGVLAVGHLPQIEDNIIVYNHGSGIQGWDVRSTAATINHNTISFNSNNGISVGGKSDIVIENNILAFNERVSLKAQPEVKALLRKNSFFGNTEIVEILPSGNYAFDPLFKAPKSFDFTLKKDSRCKNMGSDNEDLGARLSD